MQVKTMKMTIYLTATQLLIHVRIEPPARRYKNISKPKKQERGYINFDPIIHPGSKCVPQAPLKLSIILFISVFE